MANPLSSTITPSKQLKSARADSACPAMVHALAGGLSHHEVDHRSALPAVGRQHAVKRDAQRAHHSRGIVANYHPNSLRIGNDGNQFIEPDTGGEKIFTLGGSHMEADQVRNGFQAFTPRPNFGGHQSDAALPPIGSRSEGDIARIDPILHYHCWRLS